MYQGLTLAWENRYDWKRASAPPSVLGVQGKLCASPSSANLIPWVLHPFL